MTKPLSTTPGNEYGLLTAVRKSDDASGQNLWDFICECGGEKRAPLRAVRSGRIRSCGCLHRARCASGLNSLRHGDAKKGQVSRLHNLWRGMLKRCADSAPDPSKKYRARGISVCPEWHEYEPFKVWAEENGYRADRSIDRIDNDGNYEPSNCRWATATDQARNRRTSRYITVNGRTQVLAAWLAESGMEPGSFYYRLRRGWTEQEAVFPTR